MQNRVDKAISDWRKRQGFYEKLYGPAITTSRPFAKVKHSELQRIYKALRPPQNRDERVSLALLSAANRSQMRQLYPNRIIRYSRGLIRRGRELAKDTADLGRKIIRGIAAMMQDNPASFFEPPERKQPEKRPKKPSPSAPVEQVEQANVTPLQPRQHEPLEEDISQSKGLHK